LLIVHRSSLRPPAEKPGAGLPGPTQAAAGPGLYHTRKEPRREGRRAVEWTQLSDDNRWQEAGPVRVGVVGAGAVGGYFGALLSRAGHAVSLLARGAHLEAIRREGLRVRSVQAGGGEWVAWPEATEQASGTGPQDLILFAVKSYDTEGAARAMAPWVGPSTTIPLPPERGGERGEAGRPLWHGPGGAGCGLHRGRAGGPGSDRASGPGGAGGGRAGGWLQPPVGTAPPGSGRRGDSRAGGRGH